VQTIENQAAALTHTADMCANSGINVDDAAAAVTVASMLMMQLQLQLAW